LLVARWWCGVVGPSLLPWRGGVGVDGGGAAWWGPPFFPGVLIFIFIFLKKKFAECFLGTRQLLCRVPDRKHSAN